MDGPIAWITDPHLNHVPVRQWDQLVRSVLLQQPSALLVTGDISESEDVVFQLNRLSEAFAVPIYFVLGNHDFYHSSIAKTRRSVIDAVQDNPLLTYLTNGGPIQLSSDTVLVGEDGWGDATRGNYERSPVRLNDFVKIEDFYLRDPSQWKALLIEQGSIAAARLRTKLSNLPPDTRQILVATHVPPFCEACWYEGRTTDENWSPFFVCGQVGDVLIRHAQTATECQITVLCGHTHHGGVATLLPNLVVHTADADYGKPNVVARLVAGESRLQKLPPLTDE